MRAREREGLPGYWRGSRSVFCISWSRAVHRGSMTSSDHEARRMSSLRLALRKAEGCCRVFGLREMG